MGAISSDAGQPGSSITHALHFQATEHADAAGYHRQDRDQTHLGPTVGARESSNDGEPERKGFRAKLHQVTCAPKGTGQKVMCAFFWTGVVVASGVLMAIIFPRFVEHVVTPFIALLRRKLTPLQIAAVILGAVALLPFTLVLSGMPFVWLAGIVFDYWLALTIVMVASAIGMSLQYWLARYVFHDRIERFLQRSPKRHGLAVTLRAVEMAGPWKVVALLRLGPFPYHWLNYALGLCPSIKYPCYIICSVITELPNRALQVFFGRSLETLADLFRGRVKNPGVAVYNVLVLLIGIGFVVASVIYSKRLLRKLEAEELAKEQAEAAAAAAAAADDVEAAQSAGGAAEAAAAGAPAVADKLRAALPLQVEDKLSNDSSAAAGSAASGMRPSTPGSSSTGDLQVIVADASAAPNSSSLARTPSSNSWIQTGQQQQQQQETSSESGSSVSGLMRRMSSALSFRRLLSSREQPSAPATAAAATTHSHLL